MQEGSTGLYYMRARYYDSTTARFLSQDPILSANPLEVNPYQYALANPIGLIDPDGTEVVAPLANAGTRLATSLQNIPNGLSLYVSPILFLYRQGQTYSYPKKAQSPGVDSLIGGVSQMNGGAVIADEILSADPFSTEYVDVPFVVSYVPNLTANAPIGLPGVPDLTKNPFGSTLQSGTCSLNFYQSGAPSSTSGVATPADQSGSVYAQALPGIGAGFQGSQSPCGAFEYILGGLQPGMFVNPTNTAMGYLALVIPQVTARPKAGQIGFGGAAPWPFQGGGTTPIAVR
jgi:RHS repeat-associated protein